MLVRTIKKAKSRKTKLKNFFEEKTNAVQKKEEEEQKK